MIQKVIFYLTRLAEIKTRIVKGSDIDISDHFLEISATHDLIREAMDDKEITFNQLELIISLALSLEETIIYYIGKRMRNNEKL